MVPLTSQGTFVLPTYMSRHTQGDPSEQVCHCYGRTCKMGHIETECFNQEAGICVNWLW